MTIPLHIFDIETSSKAATLPKAGSSVSEFLSASAGDFSGHSMFHAQSSGTILQLYGSGGLTVGNSWVKPNLLDYHIPGVASGKYKVSQFSKPIFKLALEQGAVSEEEAVGGFYSNLANLIASQGKVNLGGWNVGFDLSGLETAAYRHASLNKWKGYFAKQVQSGNLNIVSMEDSLFQAALSYGAKDPQFLAEHLNNATSIEEVRRIGGWSLGHVVGEVLGINYDAHNAAADVEATRKVYEDAMSGAYSDKGDFWKAVFTKEAALKSARRVEKYGPVKTTAAAKVIRQAEEINPGVLSKYRNEFLIGGLVSAGLVAAGLAFGKRSDRQTQIIGLNDKGVAPSTRHRFTDFGSGYRGLQLDPFETEEGYSPFLRTLGLGTAGSLAYYAHISQFKLSPTYGATLYKWAKKFEDITPSRLGTTFGLSERASSYIVDDLFFHREQIVSNGVLTELGTHFQRQFGDVVDVVAASQGGMRFKRSAPGPSLDFEGHAGVKVRFAPAGSRMTGSAARYGRPLQDIPTSWSTDPNPLVRLWKNFKVIRHSQDPLKFNPVKGIPGKTSIEGERISFAPWYASFEAAPEASLYGKAKAGVSNLNRAIGPQAFELFERPQRMLAEIGLGLKQGSYNKVFSIPFLEKGGLLNEVLLKRALPIVAGLTAARYIDYKTGHRISNALIDVPLKANLIRADLTDIIPGARSLTSWYQEKEGDLPQYSPLALPAGGAFLGGLLHMRNVVAGEFAPISAKPSAQRAARLTRDAAGAVFPRWSVLKEAISAKTIEESAGIFWKAFGAPGKGALLGLGLMLPFIPGMLGSRKTGAELRRIYSGEEEVPVRQGRFWEVGETPWSGTRITAWRPHASVLMKSHAKEISLYGSEENYWSHNIFLHPIKHFSDPYYLESLHYKDRPYPITSPAFSNVPLIGPLLAATIGKAIKPPIRMHEDEWHQGQDYTLYSNRLEPRGPEALPVSEPVEEFSLWHAFKREAFTMTDFIGLPGFIMRSAFGAAYPTQGRKQDVYLQGSRQMTSTSKAYYEKSLGAGMFMSPDIEHGFMGYTEPLRRFVQPEGYTPQVNELENDMPFWMPGEDYLINFKKGDPHIKIDEGYVRLPGAGYAALNPELKGVDPESYPDVYKMKILGDVAPYSREYQKYSSIVRRQAESNPDLQVEYERITEQVRQTKESTMQVSKRHFNAPVDTIEGTVKSATSSSIELEEYPGRTFKFSAVGTSMADLTAEILGASNKITKAQAVRQADLKAKERAAFISKSLAEGTHIHAVIPRGAAESSSEIRAVISAGGNNINRELIQKGYGKFREELGGAEEQALYGKAGKLFGKYSEEMFFEGDQSVFNPMRYLPSPFHTKFAQERTAYSQYIQQEAIGTRMRRWDRPIHDFLAPYIRGAVAKVTGADIIPREVEHRRDLDTMSDMLIYLRGLSEAANDPKNSGRYTSQSKRTAIGANLFGSAGYVASLLPSREARYFKRFVEETDPDVRSKILNVVPDETKVALQAQWIKQQAAISAAEGKDPGVDTSQGLPYTKDDVEEYKQAKTKLQLGDYLRSRQIAKFFFTRNLHLPDSKGSAALDPNLDYQDVKLKIINQEGYDAHDFNIFDDRSQMLWRKPYVDGAVRELTSGDSRNQDQLRQAVEQLMIGAGNSNPDVRYTTRPSHRSRGNIRIEADVDDEQDLLTEIRRE